jgi:hypothetical protein
MVDELFSGSSHALCTHSMPTLLAAAVQQHHDLYGIVYVSGSAWPMQTLLQRRIRPA